MKCSCGAYKVYGAADNSPLHSDWCDCRRTETVYLTGETGPLLLPGGSGKARKGFCNWLHWASNQKPAVKIVKHGACTALYACQDCLDAGRKLATSIGSPLSEWDLNDPQAPAVP